jgi:alpha-L-fucosidase 2
MPNRIHLAQLPVLAAALLLLVGTSRGEDNSRLTLWYDHPAKVCMNEALAVGNGRLGAMILGVPSPERIVLNEDSLWTGDANPDGNYNTMGGYQELGELRLILPGHEDVQEYRRDLDISRALAHVAYAVGGVHYTREIFASHPAQVLVIRMTADKPASYTGSLELLDSHNAPITAGFDDLAAAGSLENGLKYETRLLGLNEGGGLRTTDGKLVFTHCDSLTFILGARTDYVMDYARHYRGEAPHDAAAKDMVAAAGKSYERLKAEHIADFQSLFNRVTLDLGQSIAQQTNEPTDLRKEAAHETDDPELESLLFQYGRYLLISCSRPGSLPANLQGLWNDSNSPP